ncbi:MAG: CoA pyrophosphatase, partial [Sphingobium sp.]
MRLAERLARQLTDGHARETELLTVDSRVIDNLAMAPAAVLIAVTDRPEPGVILTLRASHLRKHAGQVAFPGGRIDGAHEDAVAAALREANEEIALDPAAVEIVGVSDAFRTGTGFEVYPVLGVIPPDLPLVPHEAEVAALFEVPFDFLFTRSNWKRKELEFQGRTHHYFESYWEEHRIWGVTAA